MATNLTVLLLLALAAATTTTAVATAAGPGAAAAIPGLRASRRSRFLLANVGLPYDPSYDCSKKSPAVCLAPGSPGATCCGGQCVDTVMNADHCGGCHKVCKGPHPTCCGGRCVDLTSDEDNCGSCGNRCSDKCSYGFCDYAL
ncbi:hypothetical protein ACP4OV_015969 [Aristida adscensionis]